MYDKRGQLTFEGARQVIASGGSVLFRGTVYTRLDTLPSESDFAKGDATAEGRARQNLVQQRAALDEQLAALDAGPTEVDEDEVDSSPEIDNESEDLNNLTKAQLQRRAETAGIEGSRKMSKQELIEALSVPESEESDETGPVSDE